MVQWAEESGVSGNRPFLSAISKVEGEDPGPIVRINYSTEYSIPNGMNRALIICGSAGRGGVTEAMCQTAADLLRSEGYDVCLLFPSEMDIRHCTGCDACAKGECVLDDDMNAIYEIFGESDLLILSTPLHFSGPSSLLKTVIDRFQVYWHNTALPHPLACGAMLCAGSPEPNFKPTVSILKAFSITTNMAWAGHLEFPDTDRRGEEGVGEAVSEFIGRILAARGSLSSARTGPPCSQRNE